MQQILYTILMDICIMKLKMITVAWRFPELLRVTREQESRYKEREL
jgi:hypothetical protein